MSAPLVKTATPGIYKRGSRYVVVFRDAYGKQRKRSARTLAEARDLKSTLTADVARGEYRAVSKIGFTEYALEWIEHYGGRTSRGIREQTKADYKDRLEQYAIPFFGRMQLAAIEPRDLKRFAAHVAASGLTCRTCRGEDEKRVRCRACGGSGRRAGQMAGNSVPLTLAPVKALLATAHEEGIIRGNPAAGVRLVIEQLQDDGEDGHIKALSEDELRALLEQMPPGWRFFFEFLAKTGLRIGEAIALRWSDFDFNRQRVSVERRFYRGTFASPKSKYGRRKVRLSEGVARELEARWLLVDDVDALAFPSEAGTVIDSSNLMQRVLKPAGRRAGVPWVGFHTFRHTCATMLFRSGANAVAVQKHMGHHSPAFTLSTYVHFLDDDLPSVDFLDDVTGSGNNLATSPTETTSRAVADEEPEPGLFAGETFGSLRPVGG
jgi:integrase